MLVHGWPGGPIEFLALIRILAAPVTTWSSLPCPATGGRRTRLAAQCRGGPARLRALMEDGLGMSATRPRAATGGRHHGEDGSRLPGDRRRVHVNAFSVLPVPGDLSAPPLSDAEQAYIETGSRWRNREGFHLFLHSAAPDAIGVGFNDSPAGLAAWLVEKYRRWSDCDGEVEGRFSKDDLCDFLTMYWATGTITSSMRLYLGERRRRAARSRGEDRGPGRRRDSPPRSSGRPRVAERIFADLRRWTEMPRGGHLAAFEEPELLGDDVIAFLRVEDSEMVADRRAPVRAYNSSTNGWTHRRPHLRIALGATPGESYEEE